MATDERGGRHRADPREAERPLERDRQHGPQRRAGGNPERERRGQRVAQQPLKDDARRREGGADQRARERARQPGDEEDLRVHVVGERLREIERPPQADRGRPDERREHDSQERQRSETGDGQRNPAADRHGLAGFAGTRPTGTTTR